VGELTASELKLAVEVAKHYTTVYLFSISPLLSMIAILLALMVANVTINLLGRIFFDEVLIKWIISGMKKRICLRFISNTLRF
jgi:hypothetical protein